MQKFYICTDCRIIYAHQRLWCPNCPKQMQVIPLDTREVEALREQKYRNEVDLPSEYLYGGQIYQKLEQAETRYLADRRHLLGFDIPYDKLYRRWDFYKRAAYPYYESPEVRIEFQHPIYFRPRGSTVVFDWWKL